MVEINETEKPTEGTVTAEEIRKLYNIGYRNFIAGDYSEAADALQEVCRWNSEKYGEKGNECSDSLLLYGRCLLELGRAENCVLGNALKGFSGIEYDSQEEIKSDQFEDPEKVTPEEREKLRDDVTDAMAEADTIDEEPSKEESSEKKADGEKEEKTDKDAEKEQPIKETKEEVTNKDEEKMETEVEKKEVKPEDAEKVKDSKAEEKSDTMTDEAKPEEDSMAEDPDAIPSMQLAWEMIELARVIYKQREESMERDIKISECYLRLGEIGLENENYTGAIGDLLECQVLQKQHFEKLDRRIAETHYHLGSAYSFEKRYNNAKEHFEAARKVIIDKIDKLTEEFDAESEKESSDEKLMSEKTNEIAQLKDILPDLNSKLEDIESSIKNEKFNKVQEHLDEKKGDVSTAEVSDIQHLVKRKQEEKEKMDSAEKKLKMET